jgi:hypothetical protein
MTRNQIADFKEYVLEKDSAFHTLMDSVCVFVVAKEGADYYYLLENAFGPILPTKGDLKKYSTLLAEFKKENRIYNPVPTIVDDFWTYLNTHHENLAYRLDGNIDVVLENNQHRPIIEPNARELSQGEKDEFLKAWDEFSSTLMKVESGDL